MIIRGIVAMDNLGPADSAFCKKNRRISCWYCDHNGSSDERETSRSRSCNGW